MPRIDPLQLLNCLNVLLTPTGGIKSEQEVARISSLMEKFSKKLVSKCVYLLILKNSEPPLLSKFMGLGGWNLIYNWLIHAVEAKNYPFLIELLEVILICPVDIERLKSNPMPRQVKALSRDPMVDEKVRDLASDIVKHWLAIVKSTPPTTAPEATEFPITTSSTEGAQRLKEEKESCAENRTTDVHVSSEASAGGEEEDETYTKSTSPSSSSLDSDDSDVFVPYKKSLAKNKKKPVPKKEKPPMKKPSPDEKRKLKSKLITSSSPKGDKPGSIKLKIEVSSNSSSASESKPKKSDEKTIDEKLKEKRRMKEEKEKEKFARFKQEREKKDKHRDRDKYDSDIRQRDKLLDEKLKGELSKLIPKPLDKLGRIPKINKDKAKEKEKENAAISGDKQKEEKKPVKIDEKKPDRKEEKSSSAMKENEKNKEKDLKKDKDGKKVTSIPPPKKPVSISVEKRSAGEVKPKTVKAYNSKFRLTGLEQEVVPKPAARKLSNLPSSSPNSTSAGYEKVAVKRSPPRDAENEPIEKKPKSPDVSFTEEKTSPVQNKSNKKRHRYSEQSARYSSSGIALSEDGDLEDGSLIVPTRHACSMKAQKYPLSIK